MSDSPLEEMEAHESAEKAAEAVESKDSLLSQVTLTIAILAVAAAICASLETTEGDETIVDKNEAVLNQNQATDQWNFFQAKSLKKNSYQIAAEQAAAAGHDPAGFADRAKRYGEEGSAVQTEAKALEDSSHARWDESGHHTHRQHILTLATTLVHVGIAISSLAIFTKRRLYLNGALALAVGGLIVTGWAYLG